MKIIEDELLVKINSIQSEIEFYRLTDDASTRIILTSDPLKDFESKGTKQMAQIIGEDILMALPKVQRNLFLEK